MRRARWPWLLRQRSLRHPEAGLTFLFWSSSRMEVTETVRPFGAERRPDAEWIRGEMWLVGWGQGRGHRGIDNDRELNVTPKFAGQCIRDQNPQPVLKLVLCELVRRRDEGSVLDEAQGPSELEPCALVGLDLHVGEVVQGPGPDVCEVWFAHWLITSRPHVCSTGFSTACVTLWPARCWETMHQQARPVHTSQPSFPQPRRETGSTFRKRPVS